jgi:predicted flap endonuclease-1-like 5' DNA nuclease
MSTEEATPAAEVNERERIFGRLPDEVSGWKKYSRNPDRNLFEYWKRGSTHIVGQYEQIAANELSDGEIRICKRTYDQFNHLLNTRNLIEKEPEDADRLWRAAKQRMEEFPANEPFDSPPELPAEIGDWELVSESFEQPLGVTTWERPFGEAELIAEQTDVISNYSHTKRPHEIRYREPDTDTAVIVEEVPRTSAFEIAINSLNALTAPLNQMSKEREALKSLKGVGPAKSRQFILLGITDPGELATHINADTSLVNHHHSEAIETLLTTTIREEFE